MKSKFCGVKVRYSLMQVARDIENMVCSVTGEINNYNDFTVEDWNRKYNGKLYGIVIRDEAYKIMKKYVRAKV